MSDADPFLVVGGMAVNRQMREVLDDVARVKRGLAETEVLVKEVHRLYAITEGLWRILQEEHGYDDEKLRTMIAAIDEAEKAAMKNGRPAVTCVKCGRPLAKRLPRCMYCGAEHSVDPFAR